MALAATDRRTGYPFTAVVGLDDLRLALVLSAVSPSVGGVLVRGEKGTAKSTMVRALATLLPPVRVVDGCRFSCDPAAPDPLCPDGPHQVGAAASERPARLVELPVGATEDRVLGSLHLERALAHGVTAYEPGLLAAAHRGLLYVDEVNLLGDHLVDVLLDAAAMGRSTVEREGVSASHAARFVLVGTMNPEEGELRPQLLDRFGLTVEVAASRDPAVRVEVVRRRLAYEADPEGFAARWAQDEDALARRVARAQALLPDVVLPDAALRQVAEVCASFGVDGMRADLVTARAALAHAAWNGRRVVETEDVRAAARLALPHRARRDPFDAPGLDEERLEQALDAAAPEDPDKDPQGPDDGPPGPDGGPGGGPDGGPHGGPDTAPNPAPQTAPADGTTADGSTEAQSPADPARRGAPQPSTAEAGEPYRARLLAVPGSGAGVAGRRSRALTSSGRTIGSRRPDVGEHGRPHLLATLTAAAPHQRARGRLGRGLVVTGADLRLPVREGREGNLVLLAVDASGSMAARHRLREVKTAVLSLLLDAYQRRDKVGVVTFRGGGAEVVLPPTSSVEAAAARLRHLQAGGRTPLAEGLLASAEVLRVEALKDPNRRPLLVVVTDGRATAGSDALARSMRAAALLRSRGVAGVVVDCEDRGVGRVSLGLAGRLADALGAEHLELGEVAAATLTSAVRERGVRRPAGQRGVA
ncbi:MAG TPA: putative cobaltochelatase [Actinomycetales bacterium]|nr:putative cobaltochelatase [Actinomycetales bacterium]